MSRFKTICTDSFSRFYTKIERCGWTKNLINTSHFGFILQIYSSIKFRYSSWISTFYNKAILWTMKISSIRNNKCWRSEIHLSTSSWATTISTSISTTVSSSATSAISPTSIVVWLKLSHLLIFNINYLTFLL